MLLTTSAHAGFPSGAHFCGIQQKQVHAGSMPHVREITERSGELRPLDAQTPDLGYGPSSLRAYSPEGAQNEDP